MINQPNIYKTELEKKDILYLDNHLFVVNKKAGLLVQGDKTGDTTLLELCKAYLKKVYQKPGNVFLALVHRLDRPTSGVVVFGRTSKAASRLSEQFREHKIKKYTGHWSGDVYRNKVKCRIFFYVKNRNHLLYLRMENQQHCVINAWHSKMIPRWLKLK